MKRLIRNGSHGSGVCLFEELDANGKVTAILKSAANATGVENLRREVAGVQWYNRRTPHTIRLTVLSDRPQYMRFRLGFVRGRKANLWNGYRANREVIQSIVEHYCSVWSFGADGMGALHGDLSVDNVLFVAGHPFVLDWEHFQENAAPAGFDALFLLFESLWFDKKGLRNVCRNSESIAGMLRMLRQRQCLDSSFSQAPLEMTIRFARNNPSYWGGQVEKLPILLFDDDEVARIDRAIRAFM